MSKNSIVFFVFLFINFVSVRAQENKNQHFILSGTFGNGSVMQTNPFVKGENLTGNPIRKFQFYSIKAIWQNPAYQAWQKNYKSPYYGVGISMNNFFNTLEVGTPVSYYGVLGLPIKRWKYVELFNEFQFGITGGWKHYDSITNPKNIVIGGGLTVHADASLKLFFNISPRIDLGTGISFIHFSNGGFERPNRGFNIYSPYVEARYRFNKRPDYRNIDSKVNIEKTNDLYIMLGYGDHQLVEHELDTNYFAVSGISTIFYQQFSNSFRLGLGTDFNYWFGLNAKPDGTIGPRTIENFTIGIVVQPEMIIDRLTLVGGVGIYTRHLHYGSFNQLYQRLGFRYNVYKNWSLGFNVRSINFMLAEFLEFNMGYRFQWKK